MTGAVHISNAMIYLGVLEAGGTPSASEYALGLIELNKIVAELQAMGARGKTTVQTVDSAGVWSTTVTPVTVTAFASTATDNTYPVGWDAAIDLQLASRLAPIMGHPELVAVFAPQAQAAIAALMPKPAGAQQQS